ncbi:phosphatase PAP2 family protein [Saccharothrix variisporea]|uniref:Undecaprenyl-diphosphatase n=1 Tax=Saccharothrix variisporea TaxID=543527 RepID=A0A495X1W0_9PSEU|nr:phosphatase PAP2 family protein [Saccharothrix variisporea]RKT67184.1 undecaprenyl-diphosphatase [Saccharothrix variisporea]
MTGDPVDEVAEMDRDSLHDSEAMPTSRPPGWVVAVSLAARGGALWVPVAGVLAGVGQRRAAVRGLVAAGVALPLGHLLGAVLARRRPPAGRLPARRALPERPDSSSFPSKHAMTAAAFGTAVAADSPRAGAAVAPLVAVVAYSRVRTRVHWPSDVLGGLALGGAVAWAVRRAVHRRTP